MFGRKKTFEEIRNEEINKDLSLYYLYIYINNYENETVENKRNVREYYEKELRYKGAFYRDRKYFKINGNPEKWTPERKQRFTVESYHSSYLSGMNIYKTFDYEATYLVNLELNKPTNLVLIDVIEGIKDIRPYEAEARTEMTRIRNLMQKLDNKSHEVIIKKGFLPAKIYDMSLMQFVFKVRVNNYVRYFSTRFIKPKFLVDVGLNTLNSYIRGLINLDEGIEQHNFSKPSNPKDEEMDIDFVEIQRIYIVKRTNVFRHGIERDTPYPYELTQSFLTSMVII
jgi:hypothetical protein